MSELSELAYVTYVCSLFNPVSEVLTTLIA